MTISAAHGEAFYSEATQGGEVWTVRDENGYPAPVSTEGSRAMPFWSRQSRAERAVATVAAYGGFALVAIPLDVFRSRWLPGLARDGRVVGLNWSGARATGYDVEPAVVEAALARRL